MIFSMFHIFMEKARTIFQTPDFHITCVFTAGVLNPTIGGRFAIKEKMDKSLHGLPETTTEITDEISLDFNYILIILSQLKYIKCLKYPQYHRYRKYLM